ncbi:MAG: aminomethyltransferase family protein [Nocardioidaceae bacterium]
MNATLPNAEMVRTTPFFPRLNELNRTGLWGHWSGYLSALRYDLSAKHEYFAVRNSVGVFDTSPLYKYRIHGRDSERFLAGVMTRDIRSCRPGHAQYTVWCDDGGFLLEDGVLFRHSENEWLLTAAAPNLGYLDDQIGRLAVGIEDVSADYGILAVQGPRSRETVSRLVPEIAGIPYFGLVEGKVGDAPVTVSRTGYTGDLGYEIFVESGDALTVLDRLLQEGEGRGLRPFGEQALLMLRIEAGLALMNVEFSSSRLAFTDAERFTPNELGFGWMTRNLGEDRPFIGRRAIERELADGTSRWATVGLWIDWREYNRLHEEVGLIPPKDENPLPWESMLYDENHTRIGYATSLMYSPVLQRHIAMARVLPAYAAKGSTVHVELTVDHEYHLVPASVDRMPLFNPPRKTAREDKPEGKTA